MVTLKGHSDIVMGMIVMESLDNLVSASLDTSIRVWDTYTQKPVHTLLGHNKVQELGIDYWGITYGLWVHGEVSLKWGSLG